ncbi:MAG: hypothetical protein Q8O67_00525 [Deltaproteobacteria bacterium]|nr:hypothetical protein [Deltaproteobacteria bacterium]
MIPLLLVLGIAAADDGLEGRRVVVVPAAGDPEAAELVTAALQARGLVPVVAAARAGIDGVVVDVKRGDREQVRAQLQIARARYRGLELEQAEEAGRAALDEGLRLERPEDQRELLVDVLLFLAAVRLSIDGNDDDGARFLRLASRLEPARLELDPGLHAPSAVVAFTQAREKNAAADNAVVVVAPRILASMSPGGAAAEVVVDGVVLSADGGLLSLPEGPHLITLRAPRCESVSRVVDVYGTTTPPLNDTLAPAGSAERRKRAAEAIQSGDVAAFAVVAGLVDADVVVALSSGGKARAWRDRLAVVDVAADPADPPAFASAVIAALVEQPIVVVVPPQGPVVDEDAPLWAIGIGLGALVIVASGGVITWLLLPGDKPNPPARPVPVTCCSN